MFKLISSEHENEIFRLIDNLEKLEIDEVVSGFETIIEAIRDDIPEKKKISYGRYSIVSKMGMMVYPILCEKNIEILDFAYRIFKTSECDPFVRSLAVQLYTIHGEKQGAPAEVLLLLEEAAMDNDWLVRECSQGFVRKLVKKYPEKMHTWYMQMVKSDSPMQRRFACESLRPVADNRWFKKDPGYALSIIQNLFKEQDDYPRTSVGNSLSDWMRIDEENTLKIVAELAVNGNSNSYWIAYRACRNLVKKNPVLVMDMLKTDRYIYKDRKFYREGNSE